MTKTYYTYRIEVINREKVKVEKLDPEKSSLGEPSGEFGYQKKGELEPLLELACNNDLQDAEQARKLGEILFEILFDASLSHNFIDFYNEVVHQKEQLLRVELNIDEQDMPELAALPWEFMCLPESANLGTIYIATTPSLVFSRRRSQWSSAQPIQLEQNEKLRIALVVSAPPDLPPVEYKPVQEALEKLVTEQPHRVELLPVVTSANPEAIDTILAKEPQIFHFIGHGRLEDEHHQEIGQIAFVDPDFDEAMWVDSDYFSELFNQYRPGIVMLQACESATLSASQAFVGLASRVVQQNIPVVVAMQYEVSNATASRFARRFYQQLAEDDPVDIAAQYGRRAIAQGPTRYRKRDFATPVIFMRVQDGHLFKRQVKETERDGQSVDQIREVITKLRENLQGASEQIKIVGTYKKLHDQLHELEFTFPLIWDVLARFPNAKEEIRTLKLHRNTLRNIINNLNEIPEPESTSTNKEAWIPKLEIALEELNLAIETLDPARLNNAIAHLLSVLRRQPACINTTLQNTAKNLRISLLIDQMKDLCCTIENSNLGIKEYGRIQQELEELCYFNRKLKNLLNIHNQLQIIVDEVQLISEGLNPRGGPNLEVINISQWRFLKNQTGSVYDQIPTTCPKIRSGSLKYSLDYLDQAISDKNLTEIEDNFMSYKSEMERIFYAVDCELNTLCGDLDKAHDKLTENLNWLWSIVK